MNDWVEIDITWDWILLGLGQVVISWIGMIAAGFTAIIAVRTVLVRSKLATPLAVVLFFVLNWGMTKIVDLADRMIPVTASDFTHFWAQLGVLAVLAVLLLMLSGWMAEKKLSV